MTRDWLCDYRQLEVGNERIAAVVGAAVAGLQPEASGWKIDVSVTAAVAGSVAGAGAAGAATGLRSESPGAKNDDFRHVL